MVRSSPSAVLSSDVLAVGDIVTALFPVHDPTGHEQQGYRPAVVVGVPAALGGPRFPVVILAPLTTDRGQEWARRSPELYPRFPEGMAGLRTPSLCLLDQIRALGLERLRAWRGALSIEEYGPVREGLKRILR